MKFKFSRNLFAVCLGLWHTANSLFAVCLGSWHTAKTLFAVCPGSGHTAKGRPTLSRNGSHPGTLHTHFSRQAASLPCRRLAIPPRAPCRRVHRALASPSPRFAVPVPVPGHGRARAALSRRPEQAVPPWCFGACVPAGTRRPVLAGLAVVP